MSFQNRSHMRGFSHHFHTTRTPLADENSFVFAEDFFRNGERNQGTEKRYPRLFFFFFCNHTHAPAHV